MSKYLGRMSYTTEGVIWLTERRRDLQAGVGGAIGECGGWSLESFYYAFGEDDAVIIADVPHHATMTAISLTVGATGAVGLTTTVLITPEEVDEAVKKTVDYRPPGA